MFSEYFQWICCQTPQPYSPIPNPSFRSNCNPVLKQIFWIGWESYLSYDRFRHLALKLIVIIPLSGLPTVFFNLLYFLRNVNRQNISIIIYFPRDLRRRVLIKKVLVTSTTLLNDGRGMPMTENLSTRLVYTCKKALRLLLFVS